MEHNTSDKSSESQWQLDAVSEVLGDLSVTINDSLTVGRGSDNDLVLGSKRVSREHAKLYVVNGQLYIKDLQSSNGTFINEAALPAHKSTNIKADDMIAFANFQFQAKQNTEQTAAVLDEVVEQPTNDAVTQHTESQLAETTADSASDKAAMTDDDAVTKPQLDSDNLSDNLKEAALDTAKQPTATSEKPATPVNPIVEDVVSEKPVTSEASEAQPVADEKADTSITTSITSMSTVATEQKVNTETTESITEPAVEDEPTSTKVEAPVNPLDTSADSDFEKQSINNKVDSTQSIDIKEVSSQDKTTQTTLQQEADPDVQHAKQAATGQFATPHNNDIGTNDNKAVDQAATNPATHPEQQDNKKGSGTWFIWVFLLVIIIAAAVWLLQGGLV